jgi:serine/threonine protein phosphatase 1
VTTKLATRIQGPVAVIGDVHGQVDQLQTILDQLSELPDAEARWIVFIGDFVDRGPDPCGAVDMFARTLRRHSRTTAVCGNHEFAMCGALKWIPVADFCQWDVRWVAQYDSETTFASYGVEHGDLPGLAAAVPEKHRQLLVDLPWAVWHPQFLFVHAGLDPSSPYELQRRVLEKRDFSLNRPQWLCSKEYVEADPPPDCPLTVVSGHVRVPAVQLRKRRILIDTTGGTEGDLSCVLLPERKIITAHGMAEPSMANASAGGEHGKSWWKFW